MNYQALMNCQQKRGSNVYEIIGKNKGTIYIVKD
jgi:hypothetical protein